MFLVGDRLHGMFIPLTPHTLRMFYFPECFQTSAVRGLLLFYISVQPEEANTTTVNFCALSLYYVITITYVVLILLHGSCIQRGTI